MAKLTRKSYQRKAMVIGATAFAGMALVATGFAAWVISSSTTKPVDGTISIGAIKAQEIKINASVDKDTISFEPLKNDKSGRVRWDDTHFENLTTTLSGDFSPASYVNKFSVQLRIGSEKEITEAGSEKTSWEKNFEAARDKNYITLPTEVWCTEKLFTISDLADKTGEGVEADAKSFSTTISFGWGSKFGGVNPSKYYDEVAAGQAISDAELKETMEDFYKVMTAGTSVAADASIPFRIIIKADTSAD